MNALQLAVWLEGADPDRVRIAGFSVGYGGANRCQFCGAVIAHLDLDFEVDIDLPRRQTLHFHRACYSQGLTLSDEAAVCVERVR